MAKLRLVYTLPVTLADSTLKTPVGGSPLVQALDGIVWTEGNILASLAPNVVEGQEDFGGGDPRLVAVKSDLHLRIEISTPRLLTKKELAALRDELNGVVIDGIGEGDFAGLSDGAGIAVNFADGKGASLKQEAGAAWQPGTAAKERAELRRRVKAAAAAMAKLDRSPAGKKAGGAVKRSPKRLLKLIDNSQDALAPAKVFEELEKELAAFGNDISFLQDRQMPFVRWHRARVLRMLLDAGLNPNLIDIDGHTLLYDAVGSVPCLSLLLDRGADVDLPNPSLQETALMSAAFLGHAPSVALLLERGANRKKKDLFGQNALKHAETPGARNSGKVKALLRG